LLPPFRPYGESSALLEISTLHIFKHISKHVLYTYHRVQNRWDYNTISEVVQERITAVIGTLLALLYVLYGNNFFVGLEISQALSGAESKQEIAGGNSMNRGITAARISMGLIFAAIIIQALNPKKCCQKLQLFYQP